MFCLKTTGFPLLVLPFSLYRSVFRAGAAWTRELTLAYAADVCTVKIDKAVTRGAIECIVCTAALTMTGEVTAGEDDWTWRAPARIGGMSESTLLPFAPRAKCIINEPEHSESQTKMVIRQIQLPFTSSSSKQGYQNPRKTPATISSAIHS